MRFIYPQCLWLLLLLIPVFFIIWISFQRSEIVLKRFFPNQLITNYSPLRAVLFGLAYLMLILACAGPYLNTTDIYVSDYRKEIYFLLDVSASMNAQDVQPSRLEKSKELIMNIANKIKGERLGLIAFTDYPYCQCPLTKDINTFQLFLSLVETKQFGNKGTNLRKALTESYLRFPPKSESVNRTIVLVTDGENFSEAYHSILNKLKKERINLILIGVGTEMGSQIPTISIGEKSSSAFLMNEITNKPIITRLDIDKLRDLSREMDAPIFFQTTSKNIIADVVSRLNKASAQAADEIVVRQNKNLFYWFLSSAIVFWFLGIVLLPRAK